MKADVCLANVALDPSTVEKLPVSGEKSDEEIEEEYDSNEEGKQQR